MSMAIRPRVSPTRSRRLGLQRVTGPSPGSRPSGPARCSPECRSLWACPRGPANYDVELEVHHLQAPAATPNRSRSAGTAMTSRPQRWSAIRLAILSSRRSSPWIRRVFFRRMIAVVDIHVVSQSGDNTRLRILSAGQLHPLARCLWIYAEPLLFLLLLKQLLERPRAVSPEDRAGWPHLADYGAGSPPGRAGRPAWSGSGTHRTRESVDRSASGPGPVAGFW
jgi:hypothetical protein